MKSILKTALSLFTATAVLLGMSIPVFAETTEVPITLTVEEDMATYQVILPAAISLDRMTLTAPSGPDNALIEAGSEYGCVFLVAVTPYEFRDGKAIFIEYPERLSVPSTDPNVGPPLSVDFSLPLKKTKLDSDSSMNPDDYSLLSGILASHDSEEYANAYQTIRELGSFRTPTGRPITVLYPLDTIDDSCVVYNALRCATAAPFPGITPGTYSGTVAFEFGLCDYSESDVQNPSVTGKYLGF